MSQKIFSVFIYLIFTIIRLSFKLMSLFSQTLRLDRDEFFGGKICIPAPLPNEDYTQ